MNALLGVEGVTVTLGGVRAVDNVSFSVSEGQLCSVVGPNGAGKTTLFNTVTGFLKRDVGDVRWDGKSVNRWSPQRVANDGLARTFQNAGGFGDMTVRDNISVAARSRNERRIVTTAGRLGLEEVLDEYVRDCSLATRKLVGMSMAVACEPRMLLLDEPLAGLDHQDRDAVVAMIRRLNDEDLTILLIEHDIRRVLELSDHVVILDSGAIVAAGAPAELAGKPELNDVYLRA